MCSRSFQKYFRRKFIVKDSFDIATQWEHVMHRFLEIVEEATRGKSNHVTYRDEIEETMGEISSFMADLSPIAVMTNSQKKCDAFRVRTSKRHWLSIANKILSFHKDILGGGEEGVIFWWKLHTLEVNQW
jgi:hypothetical protein